jgi:hypothetical protein
MQTPYDDDRDRDDRDDYEPGEYDPGHGYDDPDPQWDWEREDNDYLGDLEDDAYRGD